MMSCGGYFAIFTFVAGCASLVVDRSELGLMTVPTDLPVDTTELILSSNSISNLPDNCLAHIPQLTLLIASINNMKTIGTHAFNGTGLERIYLNENDLRRFPNLLDVKSTLTKLRLNVNPIRVIKPHDLQGMDRLAELYLGNTEIYSLPDMATLLPSLKTLVIFNMYFECCSKMQTLKDPIFDQTCSLETKNAPCSYPDALIDIAWLNISQNEMNIPCLGTYAVGKKKSTEPELGD